MKKFKKPPATAEAAAAITADRYDRGKGDDFVLAREAALDALDLPRESRERNAVRSKVSCLLAYRSNAAQKKERKRKFIKEHNGNLFPPAA